MDRLASQQKLLPQEEGEQRRSSTRRNETPAVNKRERGGGCEPGVVWRLRCSDWLGGRAVCASWKRLSVSDISKYIATGVDLGTPRTPAGPARAVNV